MAISYHIYGNDGQGGVVDYDSPIATTSGLTWTVGPLGFPSDHTFGVRAFDDASGIEEANTDARVRIALDSSGNDVSSLPNPVLGLAATAMPGATCWVTWGYEATGQGGLPSGFSVMVSSVGPSQTVMVDYQPGVTGYGCTLANLTSNTPCTIGVRRSGPRIHWPGRSRRSDSSLVLARWATSTRWWRSHRLDRGPHQWAFVGPEEECLPCLGS